MIFIDQDLIDAPAFPRNQAWWDRFIPQWAAALLCAHNFIVLDTDTDTRRLGLARWIGQFPRIACAIIPGGEAPLDVACPAVATRLAAELTRREEASRPVTNTPD